MKNTINAVWKNYLKTKDEISKQKLIEYYYDTLVKKIASNLAIKIKYKKV